MKTKNYIITLYKPITVAENERAFVIYVYGYASRADGFTEIFDDEEKTQSLGLLSNPNICGIVKQPSA